MKMILSAPSKTFLTGEYAVMVGGPALVLNTSPRFELRVSAGGEPEHGARKGSGGCTGIPEGSPAGVWLRQRAPLLRELNLEFFDPHHKKGGFGASGAQFLLAHCVASHLQGAQEFNLQDIFQDYRVCAKGSGSGADILAQMTGLVARVQVDEPQSDRLEWPYEDLGFAVMRTGQKIATHTHLHTLNKQQLKSLVGPAREAATSFGQVSAEEFSRFVKAYSLALQEMKLQSPQTLKLIQPIREQPWCRAVKGCGAYGADTIVLLYAREAERQASQFCTDLGLPFVTQELTHGLEISK